MESQRASADVVENSLTQTIHQANAGVTHADFVTGARTGTIGFNCVVGEPWQFLSGARKATFNIFVLLYTIAPLILVPFWTYHEHDWWLLLGIAGSAVGTGIATALIYKPRRQNSIGAFLLLSFVMCWLSSGFHSRYTFFALCALWGLMMFMIADNVEREYAMESLIENPDLFNQAIAEGKIMIVRRDGHST